MAGSYQRRKGATAAATATTNGPAAPSSGGIHFVGSSTSNNSSNSTLRITACTKFRSLFLVLVLLWIFYVGGIITMAVQVHKLDPTATTKDQNTTTTTSASKKKQHSASTDLRHRERRRQRNKAELSPHHVVVSAAAVAATGTTGGGNRIGMIPQKSATTLRDNPNQSKENDSPKEEETTKAAQDFLAKQSIQQHVAHRTQHEEQLQKLQDAVNINSIVKGPPNVKPPQTRIMTPIVNGQNYKPPKKKRPGYKPAPYGHMVNPQDLTTHIGLGGNTGGEGSSSSSSMNKEKDNTSSSSLPSPRRAEILTAYLEPVQIHYWDPLRKDAPKPLPLRQFTEADLKQVQYPQLNSCQKLPQQFPVDNYPDEDPFLPWIHDVIPSHDGKLIQFVAQNKRRCKTGSSLEEEAILKHMAPQVALFQHVAVKRINVTTTTTTTSTSSQKSSSLPPPPRYRLCSHEEADVDGMATRFICRFKPSGQETLSVYHNDYEWAGVQKRHKRMFQLDGRDNQLIHASQLLFSCPVPDNLVEVVQSGQSVVNDWATLFLDLVPIRTPPRYGPPAEFLVPRYLNTLAKHEWPAQYFNATYEWGTDHILPLVEHAGRWENIPICQPSLLAYEPSALEALETTGNAHHLVSCLWASSGYTTRGNRYAINDGQRRLLEWMTYNRLLGFDHF
jgi:hypothetical protein